VSASLRWDGLAELKAQLRSLPADLTGEAIRIVEARANRAAADARSGYAAHVVSGNLQKGVTVTHFDRGKYSAGAIVKNTAPHASIFEHGTVARHYVTKNGAQHLTGAMPAFNVFIPAMQRQRRGMYDDLIVMMQRHGLTVLGHAA
jgi:bacteriophage HK97-gp10 putative tail-component